MPEAENQKEAIITHSRKFLEEFDTADPRWRNFVNFDEAVATIDNGFENGADGIEILGRMLGNQDVTDTLLTATLAELLTTGRLKTPETWERKPRILSRFLREAGAIDSGFFAAHGVAKGSKETSPAEMAVKRFMVNLETPVSSSSAEIK